jgi:regulator of sigma E protease
MDILFSVVGFVLIIGILVTIHEWGHFQMARTFNIKVTHFSIGFGKPVWCSKHSETQYQIAMIPLGGYVKFADEREGEIPESDLHRAFNRQSVWKRIAVVAAGPVVNLIFAWFVFALIFMAGTNEVKPLVNVDSVAKDSVMHEWLETQPHDLLWQVHAVEQQTVMSWKDVHYQLLQAAVAQKSSIELSLQSFEGQQSKIVELPINIDLDQQNIDLFSSVGLHPAPLPFKPVVGQVLENGSADQAGLKPNDIIVSVDQLLVDDWLEFVEWVHLNPGKQTTIVILRSGKEYSMPITIDEIERDGDIIGRIGLGVLNDIDMMLPYMNQVNYGFWESLSKGGQRSVEMTVMTFSMFKQLLVGDLSISNLSGPVSIAQFSGQAIQTGMISFLSLLAIMSLSIGLLNLLPIPALDGGHLMYYLLEIIKGSPVSEAWYLRGQMVGLFIIISLTLLALFNDVLRITTG